MLRRVGIAVLAVLALVAAPLAGVAAADPIAASGTIRCTVKGGIKFHPALVFGGTLPTRALVKASLSACQITGVGIVGGKLKGSFTFPTNDCTYGPGWSTGTGGASVRWVGSSRFARTTITSAWARNLLVFPTYPTLPRLLEVQAGPNTLGAALGSSVTGSFAGENAGLNAVVDQTLGALAIACSPRDRRLPGTGGLKRVTFSGTDQLGLYPAN